ncbi:Cystathionine gamma-synthase [Fulvia fulva]|uniref:cystathionine gamma-synthase n=1 Tax=Passalora fulva TaxID=5499 RepID=A0A9Q8PJV2_PASFU|nr:Cystathionine gamma-synthase [Fulvia fulva]UJO23820.1 Cystathionine gamma-synthase [Fulvia fulva]WPV35973.1 Cystathionine gamma-synthase [Fulvia fulva]
MVGVKVPGAPVALPFNDNIGETIPPDTPHAVSVSLPTWKANVGYEEGEKWVVDKMQCGYPRFFIHKSIQKLASSIVAAHGCPDTDFAMLLPSPRCASRCKEFIIKQLPDGGHPPLRHFALIAHPEKTPAADSKLILPKVSAIIYHKDLWPAAKAFWQHTGEGISSRRAEFCQRAFDEGWLVDRGSITPPQTPRMTKGPRRYQQTTSVDHGHTDGLTPMTSNIGEAIDGVLDSQQFVEERFGRNLNPKFAEQAKLAIRKRIAGSLTTNVDLPESLEAPSDLSRQRTKDGLDAFTVDDVYLFPCGMNAIYTSHRILRLARGELKSIMYGFPYVDTLKVLEKFGAGATFFGYADANDLNELQRRLEAGERYLALYCEFPGNPLLKSPDLKRLRSLADKYEFAIVVDETIGNFLNIHVLPFADIVVSSLTKIFSGDSNVMGGAMILNPMSKWYTDLKHVLASEFEDNQFEEDSVYLERNSRDYVDRIKRINVNAEAIADVLRESSKVKQVFYPKYSDTKQFYDECRIGDGGYGGLLSATFHSVEGAAIFYDNLNTCKGPSLGTNFTLASPFVLLAHYGELEWAEQYGCEASLVRFSVGLEDPDALVDIFRAALDAIPAAN